MACFICKLTGNRICSQEEAEDCCQQCGKCELGKEKWENEEKES